MAPDGHRGRVGADPQQDGGALGRAEERGEVQRREPVARPGRGQRPVVVHHLVEALGPADGGGVEHVERRIVGQDHVGQVAAAVVERPPHERHAVGVGVAGERRVLDERRLERVGVALGHGPERVHASSVAPSRTAW